MKKTFKFAALALCAAAFAISCDKSEIEISVTPKVENVTFTCQFAQSVTDSKVALANDGKTTWETGDELFIHGQKGSKAITLKLGVDEGTSISADGKTATFTVALTDPCTYSSTLFVAYPASAVKKNWDEKDYLYWSNRFNNTNALLLTGFNDTQVNDGKTLTFYNLCACISFIVSDDFDGYVFSGNSGETVGYSTYTVRFNNNKTDKKRYFAYQSSESWCDNTAGPQTQIAVSDWTGADGKTINKIFLPYDDGGAKAFSNGFTIKFLKNGEVVKVATTNKSVDLSCSKANNYKAKYLNLGNITSELKPYVAPSTHDASNPAIAGAVDLGASETANCYIINGGDASNANKVFKFKAVRGNSSANVGAISSVEVLWETYNDATDVTPNSVIAAVDYDKQDSNDYYEICFKMPATLKAGNAVIAAKNAGGNILWSWHIWVPSSAITSSDYGFEAEQWMDRNLGALCVAEATTEALVNPLSIGLFYNWGRKDPFPAPASFDGTAATTSGSFIMDGAQMTVANSYNNPTTFVSTGADANYPWTTDDSSSLWGASKTINDPCPPGYVVPAYADTGMRAHIAAADDYYVTDFTNKWFKVGSGSTWIVFPIPGYIDASPNPAKFANVGKRVYIWSSTATSTSGLSYAIRVNDGKHSVAEWERQARAGSVRCVAE